MGLPRIEDRRYCGLLSLEKEIECIAEHIDELDKEDIVKARNALNHIIGEIQYRQQLRAYSKKFQWCKSYDDCEALKVTKKILMGALFLLGLFSFS